MMLNDLAAAARASGLNVVEVDGWRGRGHGSLSSVDTIVLHHTATPRTAAGNYPTLGVVMNGRSDVKGPLCNLGLGRDGTVYVVAAGVAYHAGAVLDSSLDNWHSIGIEAEHDGLSKWPPAQYAAYVRLVAALCKWYSVPISRALGHKEVCYPAGRKPDPNFDMKRFRVDLAASMKPPVPQHRPVRVAFANLDFTRSQDREHLAYLCSNADVLLLVEAKNVRVANLLLPGWECKQDTSSDDRAGSVVAWRTTVFGSRRGALRLIADRVRGGMLNRWVNVQPLRVMATGERYRFAAAHYAPARYRQTWPQTTKALRRVRRRPHLAPIVLGVDANQDVGEVADDLRLVSFPPQDRIVGILTAPRRVRVLNGRLDWRPKEQRFTDHADVFVTLERK